MKVEFLTERTWTQCGADTGVAALEETLLQAGYVVVFDGDSYCGVLTPPDLVESPRLLAIDCLHDKPPVDADSEVQAALEIMTTYNTPVLPVFRQDRFFGVILRPHIAAYLSVYHRELEQQVLERTAQLRSSNEKLEQEIAQRKQFEAQLGASLAEKELLLKEIHHRVKNNLQVVAALIRLHAEYNTGTPAPAFLKDTESRILAMGIVHELLCSSSDLTHIAVRSYLKKLCDTLMHAYANPQCPVALDLSIDDVTINFDTAMPFGMLLNELLSNALRHAFPGCRDPRITITFASTGRDAYRLTFEDNGIGLPSGITPENADTMGFQLVCSLVRQLRGVIRTETNHGARYIIEFTRVDKEEKRWGQNAFS